jgi:hypothetical protein
MRKNALGVLEQDLGYRLGPDLDMPQMREIIVLNLG